MKDTCNGIIVRFINSLLQTDTIRIGQFLIYQKSRKAKGAKSMMNDIFQITNRGQSKTGSWEWTFKSSVEGFSFSGRYGQGHESSQVTIFYSGRFLDLSPISMYWCQSHITSWNKYIFLLSNDLLVFAKYIHFTILSHLFFI